MTTNATEDEKVSAKRILCKYLFEIERQLWAIWLMVFAGGFAGCFYPSFRSVCIGVVIGAIVSFIRADNPHK
jgi:hypothetical protein